MLAKPDLERLYRQSKEVRQPPVVLTHGLMDPRLKHADSGREVWIGNVGKLLVSNYDETTLEINPQTLLPKPSSLVASELLDTIAGKDFYASTTKTLEYAGQVIHRSRVQAIQFQ